METILENLSMDATAGKLKAITDACDEGLGKNGFLLRIHEHNKRCWFINFVLIIAEALSREQSGRGVEPYELRLDLLCLIKCVRSFNEINGPMQIFVIYLLQFA